MTEKGFATATNGVTDPELGLPVAGDVPSAPLSGAAPELVHVNTDGTTVPEDANASLADEAGHFMETVMSLRASAAEQTSRRTESFFDTVSKATMRKEDLNSNVSFIRLSHVMKITIEWKDLTYLVNVGRGKKKSAKTILDSLSGQVPPGRLLAVMGPTGCGKTSLINALAGRLPVGGTLNGDVLVNGKERGRAFRSISAYVMQDDVLFSNLTVQETFEFAARMRLPPDVTMETKTALVDQIITELGLAKAKDTRIGNNFVRGVSGGERKRTNIGIELLSGASLIFLDEPTSGTLFI